MVSLTTNRRRFMGGIAAGTIGAPGFGGDLFSPAGPTGEDAVGAIQGSGAGDAFLRLSEVEGESEDKGHEDEIDILSWSFGVVGAQDRGPGRSAGPPAFDDLHLAKHVDRATPLLLQSCASGKHHETAVLTLRHSGGETPFEYLVVTLEDVLVTSLHVGGTTLDGNVEQVSLEYGKIEVEYTPQEADGSAGAPVARGWDVQRKQPT